MTSLGGFGDQPPWRSTTTRDVAFSTTFITARSSGWRRPARRWPRSIQRAIISALSNRHRPRRAATAEGWSRRLVNRAAFDWRGQRRGRSVGERGKAGEWQRRWPCPWPPDRRHATGEHEPPVTSSSTVMRGTRLYDLECPGNPATGDQVGGQPIDALIKTANFAAARRCTPVIRSTSVVLPAPFGPIRPTKPPARSSNEMSLTATRPPKRWYTRQLEHRTHRAAPTGPLARPRRAAPASRRRRRRREEQDQGNDDDAESPAWTRDRATPAPRAAGTGRRDRPCPAPCRRRRAGR